MKYSTVSLALLSMTAFLGPLNPTAPASAQTGKASVSAPSPFAVLPLSEGSEMELAVHPQLPMAGTMKFWTPKPAELRRLEADMPKYLMSYCRQYIGASQGGKRLILINGFSSDLVKDYTGGKFDWHKRTVSVMDGGRGFFQATYDPDTHQFVGPHFNGVG